MTDGPPAPRNEQELVTVCRCTTPDEALWAQNVLASAGICAVIPDSQMSRLYGVVLMLSGGGISRGIRIQVSASQAETAMEILASSPYRRLTLAEIEADRASSLRCPSCGSVDLAQVPQGHVAQGRIALRCLQCNHRLPDLEGEALDDRYPVLPLNCHGCGHHGIHPTEPPPQVLLSGESLEGRQWIRCDECALEWEDTGPITGEDHGDIEAGPVIPEEACPLATPAGCPHCRSDEIVSMTAPPWAMESPWKSLLKRLIGRGWKRCGNCGREWEE